MYSITLRMVGDKAMNPYKDTQAFYTSGAWHHKREEVLKRDHYECCLCRTGKGYAHRPMHSRAEIVHHVKHLKDRPDLRLSDTYTDSNGVSHRQLISVCKRCHEEVCHPERLRHRKSRPVTRERW